MSEVTLKGITKSYGGHLAIPPLDLEIPKGKFVTLLGPSGCGKTTTLRIIAGLEQPSSGELSLGGRTVYFRRDRPFRAAGKAAASASSSRATRSGPT